MEAAGKKKRAPRVPAPGAERVVLTGVLAATDNYGRVRLLLLEEAPDGKSDYSWRVLRAATTPFTSGAPLADATGCVGEAFFVLPARYREHWLNVAAELRGQWVRVEATQRRYVMKKGNGCTTAGVSLDLTLLEAAGNSRGGRAC
jgi:hypothetical protein